jgi:hypothetical protein
MRRRIHGPLVVGLLLTVGGACAPPGSSPRSEGVTRVLAQVRGIT